MVAPGLAEALAANKPGSAVPHVLVALPSFSVGDSLLAHYARRLPALEHRYLLAQFLLTRIETCEMVFVTCQAPGPEVLDYYASLVPVDQRASMRARLRILEVPDQTARAVAAKLLGRPDLIAALRDSFRGRPAFVEPWNVGHDEVLVAAQLGAPINGTPPELWTLGYKSSGRRLFAEAGVPTPLGFEDVRSVDGVVDAALRVRAQHPGAAGVVVKTDDSGAGDGNQVIRFDRSVTDRTLRAVVDGFPSWYLADLSVGGVVEELVAGSAFASPSVQADILPDGQVSVLATHEQVLGGPTGQVFLGCRFPASPAYAGEIGRYGRAVGEVLARRGALGRFSVDFAAAQDANGRWEVFALEINLRKGGTTHPYAALRSLAPGRYDVDSGRWVTAEGEHRCYSATDNLLDPAWLGRPPSDVIAAVADAGLQFDPSTRTGVVLHMLSCLEIDGRLGLTAIGTSPAHATDLYSAAAAAIGRRR